MSSGVDDNDSRDADLPTATLPHVSTTAHTADHPQHGHHHHHHILIEPEEDRWRWRRKIREDKRRLAVYRIAVALLGLFLVALGFVSGPIRAGRHPAHLARSGRLVQRVRMGPSR